MDHLLQQLPVLVVLEQVHRQVDIMSQNLDKLQQLLIQRVDDAMLVEVTQKDVQMQLHVQIAIANLVYICVRVARQNLFRVRA